MEGLLDELDKTRTKVVEHRREMHNKIEALIGELNNSKQNILKQVSNFAILVGENSCLK